MLKNAMKSTPILFTFITCLLVSCKIQKNTETNTTISKNAAPVCDDVTLNYAKHIEPIFNNHCNNCHNSRKMAGGYDFTNTERVVQAVNDKKLLGVIKWEHGFMKMPMRAKQLDSASINKIDCWIKNGMKL